MALVWGRSVEGKTELGLAWTSVGLTGIEWIGGKTIDFKLGLDSRLVLGVYKAPGVLSGIGGGKFGLTCPTILRVF